MPTAMCGLYSGRLRPDTRLQPTALGAVLSAAGEVGTSGGQATDSPGRGDDLLEGCVTPKGVVRRKGTDRDRRGSVGPSLH
jgi:hypothetical protein